jgi:glycosyltransferase involved in cell wall biosynthesis
MKLRSVKLWWASHVYKHVSKIVTVSHACKRSLVEDYAVSEDRVSVVPNGVRDIERMSEEDVLAVRASLGLTRDDVAALWAGRFTIEKGVDVLLRALVNGSEWNPRVRVFLAGDGPLRRELETEYKHLVDSRTVTFLGWRKDVGRLLQAVDFVVMPSRFESFGLFLVEAMVASRACVASNVLGIPEVVADGETGILVPSENPEALADGMKRLASDPALCASMGRAARMRYEKLFTFERCVKLFQDEISNSPPVTQ